MVTISGSFSTFSVDDLPTALTFYRDTLGLDVVDDEMGLTLRIPGGNVFIYPKDDHEPATFTVLNLEVADIDVAIDELAEAGIGLERYDGMPQDEKGVLRGREADRGPDIAWFTDPAGNMLSVVTAD